MTAVRGSVAVVTGAASGIGLGIASALRRAGAEVVLADLEEDAAERAAASIGGRPAAVDVANPASVESLIAKVVDESGRIDILVNNAGVGPAASIAEMTLDDWRWLLDVNLWGVINGVHAALPRLLGQASGHIVNVSSMSALAPMPPLGGYAVTKAGVAALTEVLSRELEGSGVRATLVVPGPTRTAIASSLRHRKEERGALREFTNEPPPELWRSPTEVGDQIAEAIVDDTELVVTHPQLWSRVAERNARIATAFRVPPKA